MIVANAEAVGRDTEAGHALHEAGGQASKPAVAERRVRFQGAQAIEVHPELGERKPHRFGQARIVERVHQHAARQEFERQIVDPLAMPCGVPSRALQPAIDDPVAQRQRRRHEPVAITGDQRVSPGRVGKLLRDQAAQRLDVFLVHGGACAASLARDNFRYVHRNHPDLWVPQVTSWSMGWQAGQADEMGPRPIGEKSPPNDHAETS